MVWLKIFGNRLAQSRFGAKLARQANEAGPSDMPRRARPCLDRAPEHTLLLAAGDSHSRHNTASTPVFACTVKRALCCSSQTEKEGSLSVGKRVLELLASPKSTRAA